jgi:hypothetical protein
MRIDGNKPQTASVPQNPAVTEASKSTQSQEAAKTQASGGATLKGDQFGSARSAPQDSRAGVALPVPSLLRRVGQDTAERLPPVISRSGGDTAERLPPAIGQRGADTAERLPPAADAQPVSKSDAPGAATPESQAEGLLQLQRQGSLPADQLVDKAKKVAEEIRAKEGPAGVERFYNKLAAGAAQEPGLQNTKLGEGGQCYQNGNISGETPDSALQVSLPEVFQHEAGRAGFEARMKETLGPGFDPQNLEDVKTYMDVMSKKYGVEGVRTEMNNYLTNFYTHGHSVNYNPTGTNWATFEPRIDDIQNKTLQDGAGRKVIDCDGFAAVAKHLTSGIDGGRYDFQWGYTSGKDGAHVLGGVVDTRTGMGFVIDNNETDAIFAQGSGESQQDAIRRGMTDSLHLHHGPQEIGSNGLGIDPTYGNFFNNRLPVV